MDNHTALTLGGRRVRNVTQLVLILNLSSQRLGGFDAAPSTISTALGAGFPLMWSPVHCGVAGTVLLEQAMMIKRPSVFILKYNL